MERAENLRVAVIIPCLNEEATVGGVLEGFRASLPNASLYVVDNNSSDRTAQVALDHGATVLRETRPGKGFAVRKAFREVEADAYLMVDGDGTYSAADAKRMLDPILQGTADVVVGTRLGEDSRSEFRFINRIGNRILLRLLNAVFGAQVTDLLSGYRAMTREFVKQTPVLSVGFELETELSVLALERAFRTVEIPVNLRSRPHGSHSKISVIRDGLRILNAIFTLLRDYRPFSFFGWAGVVTAYLGILPGLFVTYEFMQYGTVRVPTAVLATGLVLSGLLLILVGVMLTALNRRFRELDQRLTFLADEVQRQRQAGAPPGFLN
jgi:glycosyltransferase involved in cell wall biosynthesis